MLAEEKSVSRRPTSRILLYKPNDAFIDILHSAGPTQPGLAASERLADTKKVRSRWRSVSNSDFKNWLEEDILQRGRMKQSPSPRKKMDAETATNTPSLPSIVDASTKEEDYFFTSLGLDDEEDNQDPTSGEATKTQDDDLLRPRNRDERMRAAYEESKRLYKAEHGYTETGVSSFISLLFPDFC